jgi:hypothetical protein
MSTQEAMQQLARPLHDDADFREQMQQDLRQQPSARLRADEMRTAGPESVE